MNINKERKQLEEKFYRAIISGNLEETRKVKSELEKIYEQMKLKEIK